MSRASEHSDGFPMAVAVEGGLALAALVMAWVFGVPLRLQFPGSGSQLAAAVWRGVLATLPMLAGFAFVVKSKQPWFRQLREQVEWLVREMFPAGNIAQFALISALAGIGEELLFRGVIQLKLGNWATPLVGLCLTSLLFGLAHALSKLYFAFAVIVGAFLGWLTVHYHDLVAPMVAHGLYDFVALVYLSKTAPPRSIPGNEVITSLPTDEYTESR